MATEKKIIVDYDRESSKTEIVLGKGENAPSVFVDLADGEFVTRLNVAIENIERKTEELQKKGEAFESLEELHAHTEYIREQLDYAFNAPISDAAFGLASPMTLAADGNPLIMKFLNAITPVIEKEFGKRVNKMNVTVQKYANQKGQHPAYKK